MEKSETARRDPVVIAAVGLGVAVATVGLGVPALFACGLLVAAVLFAALFAEDRPPMSRELLWAVATGASMVLGGTLVIWLISALATGPTWRMGRLPAVLHNSSFYAEHPSATLPLFVLLCGAGVQGGIAVGCARRYGQPPAAVGALVLCVDFAWVAGSYALYYHSSSLAQLWPLLFLIVLCLVPAFVKGVSVR